MNRLTAAKDSKYSARQRHKETQLLLVTTFKRKGNKPMLAFKIVLLFFFSKHTEQLFVVRCMSWPSLKRQTPILQIWERQHFRALKPSGLCCVLPGIPCPCQILPHVGARSKWEFSTGATREVGFNFLLLILLCLPWPSFPFIQYFLYQPLGLLVGLPTK